MVLSKATARIAMIGALSAGVPMAYTAAGAGAAGGAKLCIPESPGKATVTPNVKGECKPKYRLVELGAEGKEGPEGKPGAEGKPGPEGKPGAEGKPGPEGKSAFNEAEIATVKSILPFIKFVEKGVAGKPTIQFSGVNVQIVSGAGKTNAAVNGEGNLAIGYDENAHKFEQTGSHDLILGEEQAFTSFGGIVAGAFNSISGEYASVTGGEANTASAKFSAVSGGDGNSAIGLWSSVSGGAANKALGSISAISGGSTNKATGMEAAISGGELNSASEAVSSVSAGKQNTATAEGAWVGGGLKNNAHAKLSSVFGGKEVETKAEFEAMP
jgi:hypothetical protein